MVRGDFEIPGAAHDHEQLADGGIRVGQGKTMDFFHADAQLHRSSLYSGEVADEEIRDQVAEAVDLENRSPPHMLRPFLRGRPDPIGKIQNRFSQLFCSDTPRKMRGYRCEDIATVKCSADLAEH